jgi:hypothetical protein
VLQGGWRDSAEKGFELFKAINSVIAEAAESHPAAGDVEKKSGK